MRMIRPTTESGVLYDCKRWRLRFLESFARAAPRQLSGRAVPKGSVGQSPLLITEPGVPDGVKRTGNDASFSLRRTGFRLPVWICS
jgi:hypothetical protein